VTAPLIDKWTNNPAQLFLLDGAGALLSAFMLGVVLVSLQPMIGMPISTLYLLAAIPCCFIFFDIYHSIKKSITGQPLRIICILNLAYCCLSLVMSILHRETLTAWGWIYIIGECLLILMIARLEWLVAGELDRKVNSSKQT